MCRTHDQAIGTRAEDGRTTSFVGSRAYNGSGDQEWWSTLLFRLESGLVVVEEEIFRDECSEHLR
jgi:hypothetical protein